MHYLCSRFPRITDSNRGVAQLVALLVWDQAVARSSRVAPTTRTESRIAVQSFLYMKIQNPILQLALPSVVTNITVPLLGLVDTTVVGHMGRAEYIAAVAIGTTIFNMVYWLLGFIRMGTTGIVSQAHGAGDEQGISEGLRRSLMFGLLVSLCLLLLQTPLLRLALWMMEPTQEVALLASDYFRVCIWGAPAMLASYALTGWFIGMQDTRTPMRMAILQNLLNILATCLFVFVFDMGVRGVALGTVVGLYAGCLYAAHCLPPSSLKGKGESAHAERKLPSLGGVGGGLFLRTLCLVAVTVYFTTAGSRMGTLTLDANALLMQLFIVFSYFTDGLANAAEALCGEYVGRQDGAGLRQTIRSLFRWGFGLALIFTVLYAVCGSWFLALLTNQHEVVAFARDYLAWVVVVPLVGFAAFVWDGVYIGMTLTNRMFLSMLVSAIVFFALWFAFGSRLGNHALWLAFLSYLGTRSLMQTFLYKR